MLLLIIEPNVGHPEAGKADEGGAYERVSRPALLKTASKSDGAKPSEFTMSIDTTMMVDGINFSIVKCLLENLPSSGFDSIHDFTDNPFSVEEKKHELHNYLPLARYAARVPPLKRT